jgi:hypothetical protein
MTATDQATIRIATDVYPTRYAAFEHPGCWAVFTPVDGLYRPCTEDAQPRPVADLGAYKRGGEMAVLHLPKQNEHYADIVDGTYVQVIIDNGGGYIANCHHTGPTRERSQFNATLRASSRDGAIAAAEQWIADLG